MRPTRVVLVALVAAFAFSAVAASSALASPEWYVKKAGKYEKVSEAVNVGGTVSFDAVIVYSTFKEFPGEAKCHGSVKGELKSGGISDITSLTIEKCEVGKWIVGIGRGEARNFPWQAELYKEGSEIRSRLVNGGHGTPEYTATVKWTGPPAGEEKVSFTFPSSHMGNLLSGFVESSFDAKSEQTYSKLDTIEWKGSFVTVKPLEKSGVEAIKVE
jgi:hypothetical protein